MAIAPLNGSFYADPASLTTLKRDAAAQTPEAVRETAKQFESLFTTMMLKSMRDATPGDSLSGSDQQDFYQDMFDQQLAVQLSKGKGLGLADVLVRQLMQGAGMTPDVAAQGVGGGQSAAAGTKSTAGMNWPPRGRAEFVESVLPAAREVGRRLGVDPATVVAHAALETGWGKSTPTGPDGRQSFNLFGIKAGNTWRGASVSSATHEFGNGRMRAVESDFRAYESPEQSMNDYANVIGTNPRYAAVLGTGSNVEAFAQALQSAGYATDPDYATKLSAIAHELKSRFERPISAGET